MDPLIGTIQAFPYGFAPMGWLLCNGAELSINQYTPLFSLISCTYGGDGRNTFKIPNLIGAAPDPNMQYYIVYMGLFPARS